MNGKTGDKQFELATWSSEKPSQSSTCRRRAEGAPPSSYRLQPSVPHLSFPFQIPESGNLSLKSLNSHLSSFFNTYVSSIALRHGYGTTLQQHAPQQPRDATIYLPCPKVRNPSRLPPSSFIPFFPLFFFLSSLILIALISVI